MKIFFFFEEEEEEEEENVFDSRLFSFQVFKLRQILSTNIFQFLSHD